jgi:hypothetical protein
MRGTRKREKALAVAAVAESELMFAPSSRMNGSKGPTRIMFIENKSGGLTGPARIGRVSFSKTGRTLYYQGRKFQSLKGGYKANYFDIETGDHYWISGPKRNGQDFLYGGGGAEIDEDCREEYWTDIRRQPNRTKSKLS